MAIRLLSLITQAQVDPGKPTEEARLLNLVMKTILVASLVALVSSIILFAYFAEWHDHGGSDDNGCCEPYVQLDSPEAVGGNAWEVWVSGVSDARDLENWKAVLLKNGTLEDVMDPLTNGFSVDMFMFFIDLGGEGQLTSGDLFQVACDPGSVYQLSIIWKDSGNERGSVQWHT